MQTANNNRRSAFDAADRITTSGIVYDTLGRTTTLPDADALDAGNLTVGYHVNDLVHTIRLGTGPTTTYTLDVTSFRSGKALAREGKHPIAARQQRVEVGSRRGTPTVVMSKTKQAARLSRPQDRRRAGTLARILVGVSTGVCAGAATITTSIG